MLAFVSNLVNVTQEKIQYKVHYVKTFCGNKDFAFEITTTVINMFDLHWMPWFQLGMKK